MVLTDAQLVRRFVDGDNLALAALYQRFKVPLYGFCLRIPGSWQCVPGFLILSPITPTEVA